MRMMKMSSKSEKLESHIIELSNADTFEEAKKEWKWVGIGYAPEWDKCPCTQAIKEICHIQNTENGNTTYVGNNCINTFLGIETGGVFNLLKNLIEDNDYIIPPKLIDYAYRFNYIYYSEIKFLKSLNKNKKRKLTEKQDSWRKKIVRRILNKINI